MTQHGPVNRVALYSDSTKRVKLDKVTESKPKIPPLEHNYRRRSKRAIANYFGQC